MVHNVTKRPRRKAALPVPSLDESLDTVVAVREPGAEAVGRDDTATPLSPAEAEAGKVAALAGRLAALGGESRAKVLAELNAALGEDSRARVKAYLDVPLEPGLDRERAAALDVARRTEGAWPDGMRQEFAGPEETGLVIPVPRSMHEGEALELAACVVELAPLDEAARPRVLACLNSLSQYQP